MRPAVALLEFSSVAAGIQAGDAMVKRAPLQATYAGTVQPGKYLVLVGGDTASVEEAVAAGRAAGSGSLVDEVLLADVHPAVVEAVAGRLEDASGEALGILETASVAAVLEAADAGRKGAAVTLAELRLADGLGGKGYLLFSGPLAEVEAAVDIGAGRVAAGQLVGRVVIPQLHPEMGENLAGDARFRERAVGIEPGA